MKAEPVVLCRTDYECFVVELPTMPESSVPTALRYHLRTLYPGDPGSTAIDFVPNGPDRRSLIVFAADGDRIASRRAEAEGRDLLAPTLVLRAAAKGDCSAIYWAADWAELARFRGGALAQSVALRRGDEIASELGKLLSPASAAPSDRLVCVLDEGCQADAATLRSTLSSLVDREPEIVTLRAVARGRSRRDLEAFAPRSRRRARSRLALCALLALNLLSLIGGVQLYAGRVEAARERAKKAFESAKASNASAIATKATLSDLEARYAKLKKAAGPEPYGFIADLAAKLGEGAQVRSLRLDGAQFQLEAEGVDSLAVLARFGADERYASVKLSEAVPLASGGERFSISGSLRR